MVIAPQVGYPALPWMVLWYQGIKKFSVVIKPVYIEKIPSKNPIIVTHIIDAVNVVNGMNFTVKKTVNTGTPAIDSLTVQPPTSIP